MNFDELVAGWVRFYQVEVQKVLEEKLDIDNEEFFWASTLVDEYCKKDPLIAMDLIDRIFAATNDERVLACLGAGPLEDLLVAHGELIWPAIELRASKDKRFKDLLSCVSPGRLEGSIRSKLQILIN